MSADTLDRAAVRRICARFGVVLDCAPTADDREHWQAVILDETTQQPFVAFDGRECWHVAYDTPNDAVAECIMARYGIYVQACPTHPGAWFAQNGADFVCRPEKLDAVARLAAAYARGVPAA